MKHAIPSVVLLGSLAGALVFLFSDKGEVRAIEPLEPTAANVAVPVEAAAKPTESRVRAELEALRAELLSAEQDAAPTPPASMLPFADLEPLTEAQLDGALERYFSMHPNMVTSFRAGFVRSSLLEEASIVRKRFGADLDDVAVDAVLAICAPYNEDFRVLAELYTSDYQVAMMDTFRSGHFQVEKPAPDGTLRDQLPGESRARFPGWAAYYTIDQMRYPHLEGHRTERARLAKDRDREVWEYLRSR